MDNSDIFQNFLWDYAEKYRKQKLSAKGIVDTKDVSLKYVLYARKSTKGKDKQEHSVDDQIKECKEFADRNGLLIIDIVKEEETSHIAGKRDEFYSMLENIRKGKYNAILAWHPDRLARNMKDAGTIIDYLDRNIILDLKFSSYTFVKDASGLMALGIQFVLAKNYSDNLSVNTTRGNKRRLEESKVIRSLKWGYKLKDKENKYPIPDGKNFDLMRRAFEMVLESYSLPQIQDFLIKENLTFDGKPIDWTSDSKKGRKVSNKLADPFYAGINVFGEELYDLRKLDTGYKPVVTAQEFLEVQRALDKRNTFSKPTATTTVVLRDMVTCAYCNNFMTPVKPQSGGKSKHRYLRVRCTNPKCKRSIDGLKREFRGKDILEVAVDIIENGINFESKDLYKDFLNTLLGIHEKELMKSKSRLKQIDKQINELDSKERHYSDSLIKTTSNNRIKEIKDSMDKLFDNRSELKAEKEILKGHIVDFERTSKEKLWTYEQIQEFYKKLAEVIRFERNQFTVDAVLKMLFVNFTVDNEKVLTYRLKSPFDKYQKMGEVQYGVEDGT